MSTDNVPANEVHNLVYSMMNAGLPVAPIIYCGEDGASKSLMVKASSVAGPTRLAPITIGSRDPKDWGEADGTGPGPSNPDLHFGHIRTAGGTDDGNERWQAQGVYLPPGTKVDMSVIYCKNVLGGSTAKGGANWGADCTPVHFKTYKFVGQYHHSGTNDCTAFTADKSCPVHQVFPRDDKGEVTTSTSSSYTDFLSMLPPESEYSYNGGGTLMLFPASNLGTFRSDDDRYCGMCSFQHGIQNTKIPHARAYIYYIKTETTFDGLESFDEYLREHSCMEFDLNKRIAIKDSSNENRRFLSNYQPGTAQCDALVEPWCQQNIDDPRCVCFKEELQYLDKFGQTPVPYPVQCLGDCSAKRDSVYRKALWAEPCNVEICSSFITANGESLVLEDASTIVCNGEHMSVDPTVEVPEKAALPADPPVIDPGTEGILIGIGILFFLVFVVWLALFLRRKI